MKENLKVLFLDFDGVLTDNNVYISETGEESVRCSRSDGIGISMLTQLGMKLCVISTETNNVVSERCDKLQLQVFQGVSDKMKVISDLLDQWNIDAADAAFMGNDINDLDAMRYVGVAICPADAHDDVKKISHVITSAKGGFGAVREISEMIMARKFLSDAPLKDRPIARFPECQSLGYREWGEEHLLVHSNGQYTMKLLKIKSGAKGGLQYHRLKDEAAYVLSGRMIVRFESGKGCLEEKIIEAGDWVHFPSLAIHQEEAVSDVTLLEVSTPHFNDRVRVEEFFGQKCESGLPTTQYHEIRSVPPKSTR